MKGVLTTSAFWAYASTVLLAVLTILFIFFVGHPAATTGLVVLLCAGLWRLRVNDQNIFAKASQVKDQKIARLESKAWYFESIVTNSKDILFTTDLDHRIVKFNKEAEETFGGNALDHLGHHVRTLFEEPEKIDEMLLQVRGMGKVNLEELKVINKETNQIYWVSVQISSLSGTQGGKPKLLDRNKSFVGEIFTGKNVTHRKMLEDELKSKNEQLTKLSITDSLTELYNFRHLKTEARRHQKLHYRYPERPLSVALIDVDNFKTHNDKHGHLAGDKLLMELSDIIQKQIRQDLDTAYRYGGDEFVILLPETDSKGAHVICSRVLKDYNSRSVGDTSLSIGIAQYQQGWGVLSASLMVNRADEAMYMVKKAGGNGIQHYGQPLSDELKNRPEKPPRVDGFMSSRNIPKQSGLKT